MGIDLYSASTQADIREIFEDHLVIGNSTLGDVQEFLWGQKTDFSIVMGNQAIPNYQAGDAILTPSQVPYEFYLICSIPMSKKKQSTRFNRWTWQGIIDRLSARIFKGFYHIKLYISEGTLVEIAIEPYVMGF